MNVGPQFIHLELSSFCNKKPPGCSMCGRRKLERKYPELCDWGNIEFELVKEISKQVLQGTVVQFHGNGEPTLYPQLGEALKLFKHCIRSFNTNGKLLIEKADEIIGNLETLVISVIQDDLESDEQYSTVCDFIRSKGIRKPSLVFRILGKVDKRERWYGLPGVITTRILHDPDGSRNYEKRVTIPEIGICLDLLTHLAINRYGEVSVCVRFDPEKHGVIGNLKYHTLDEIWNGKVRKHYIDSHLDGLRHTLNLCGKCDFYGVPTSP